MRMASGKLVPPGEYVIVLEVGERKLARKALTCKMPGVRA